MNNNIKLSILIACYNWDVYTLIKNLHTLCLNNSELTNFEIICIDDASTQCFANKKILDFSNVYYKHLNKNIGRSKIRNLMAEKAKYEWLLFIDADSQIFTSDFITNYVNIIKNPLQSRTLYYGSTLYSNKKPNNKKLLHWKYGKNIESKRKKYNFSSHHFMIEKKYFSMKENVKFDESILTYGYEDVFFIIDNNLQAIYIKNPLYHIGLKDSEKFIRDTENAIHNLLKRKKNIQKIKIVKVANILTKFYLDKIIIILFQKIKSRILKNLYSKNPSIIYLQFYKIGYFLEKKYHLIKKR